MGAKEITQSLRALTAIPEDLGSVPSTYMATPVPGDLSPFSGLRGHCMQTKTKNE